MGCSLRRENTIARASGWEVWKSWFTLASHAEQSRREAQALQLGLVLASGERHLLLEAMEQDGLYRFAHELAEYLEVPLLDSTEDE